MDLQDALARVAKGDNGCGSEIWVAQGTYKPADEDDRDAAFDMVDGVEIYGGFAGYETSRSQRDYINNVTILSGDIDPDDDSDSYAVVTADGVGSDTILDGFVITKETPTPDTKKW